MSLIPPIRAVLAGRGRGRAVRAALESDRSVPLTCDLPADVSFYEAGVCQAPRDLDRFRTHPRRSGLLIKPGARGGGAANHPDVRPGRAASIYLTVLRGENPEGSRAARHQLHGRLDPGQPLSTYSTLAAPHPPTGGPLESSLTLRLPSIRGHRDPVTHQLRPCAGPLGRAAPSIGRFPGEGNPETSRAARTSGCTRRRGRGEALMP
jgi:hypothetical protein